MHARRVVRVMADGSTEPLLVRADDGADYVVKPGSPTVPDALHELLGALLAPVWGIRVPEPVIVCFAPMLVRYMAEGGARLALAARQIGLSGGLAFGSRKMIAPLARTAEPLLAWPEEMRRLLRFDLFIGNPDRTRDNPNLLFDPDGPIAIDHALGFGWLRGQESDRAADLSAHLAWTALTELPVSGLIPPCDRRRLRQIAAMIPDAWLGELERLSLVEKLEERWEEQP